MRLFGIRFLWLVGVALSSGNVGCSGEEDTNGEGGDGDGDLGGDSGDGDSGDGDQGSSSNATHCGRAFAGNPPNDDDIEWETLPNLYGTPDKSAGESSVVVGPSNVIYVSATVAQDTWQPPGEVIVQRFLDGSWEVLGGGPVATDPTGLAGNLGLTVDCSDRVFVGARAGGTTAVYEAVDDQWVEVDLPVVPWSGGFGRDVEGRAVIVGNIDDETSQVVRLNDGSWETVGAAFNGNSGALPSGHPAFASEGRMALVTQGTVRSLEDGVWRNLGEVDKDAAWTTIAMGWNADLFASYRVDSDAGTLLFGAKYNAQADGFESLAGNLEFEGPGASYSVLEVDPWGRLVAAWRESAVYVGLYGASGWQPYLGDGDISQSTEGGTLPSIALSAEGLPVIAWEGYNAEAGGVLGVARAKYK